jgi:broad specificity phosphatase PhoE
LSLPNPIANLNPNPFPKDAPRRRIFLMRHGSVTYFDATGKPLEPDSAPLNARGVEEAQAAGSLFAACGLNFDRVIVSGLKRTVQTAAHVLNSIAQKIEVHENPKLVEIKGGNLGSIADADLKSAFHDAFDGAVQEHTRFLGGESVGELLDRVLPEVDALRADPDWEVALLVLHGGVNRAILSYLLTGTRCLMGGFAQSPACINAIDVGEQKSDVVLRAVNLSPADYLQTSTRKTTMETFHEQYEKYRTRIAPETTITTTITITTTTNPKTGAPIDG